MSVSPQSVVAVSAAYQGSSGLTGRCRTASRSPFRCLWRSAGARPPSRSCRGASPPAHAFSTGRDRSPIQGLLTHHREQSRGSSRETLKIQDLRSSCLPECRGPRDCRCGSGRDQSGRTSSAANKSPRHGLTRRCSGLASLAAELHSLGRAGPDGDHVSGRVRLRPRRSSRPCPLITSWQPRRAQ